MVRTTLTLEVCRSGRATVGLSMLDLLTASIQLSLVLYSHSFGPLLSHVRPATHGSSMAGRETRLWHSFQRRFAKHMFWNEGFKVSCQGDREKHRLYSWTMRLVRLKIPQFSEVGNFDSVKKEKLSQGQGLVARVESFHNRPAAWQCQVRRLKCKVIWCLFS